MCDIQECFKELRDCKFPCFGLDSNCRLKYQLRYGRKKLLHLLRDDFKEQTTTLNFVNFSVTANQTFKNRRIPRALSIIIFKE